MNTSCSIALLESALAGSLPADAEDALHQHLEECEQCSAALERMAGGPAWCQEAAALLASDELDADVPARDEWSDIDFTVEHLEPADEPNVLGRLGGYQVLEVIGRGGMGVVLKAFDPALKRCVAIKVLAPHLAQSSLARKRFAREAQAAAAVVHANVLAIHHVQPNGRLPFLVMPLVAGESLAQRLAEQGRLELKEILRVGMQVAAGLGAAHEQGLVHRDVKPANILLEKGVERAVITDFGLARAADDVALTRWGIIAGTPQYMSPEQARGEPLDARSDLFSLGCVLYEMATGVSPFRADSMMATMRRLVDDSPQSIASLNPELPPWFATIVDRLLEKDPSRRFGTAREVSELLEGCLAHVQQPASEALPANLPRPARRRNWWPPVVHFKGVLAMIALSLIGLVSLFLVSAEPPDIAGQWSGEDWGQVVLTNTKDAEYDGTFSDPAIGQSGEIHLKWSRIERRFNGTWREGDERFGDISLRVVDGEIHGAMTTDAKSKVNVPRLADFVWTRVASSEFDPVIERVTVDGGKVVIEGRAPANARIFFYAGNDRSNGWSCAFPTTTRFSATLEKGWQGLTCRVVPVAGKPVLTMEGTKQIGAVVLSEGQLAFSAGQPHSGPDGGSTATIGEWTAKSGEKVSINVFLSTPQPSAIGSGFASGLIAASLGQQPQLRFLAWQDKYATTKPNGAFHADLSPANDPSELHLLKFISPCYCDASALSKDKRNPPFLHLWFSHPLFDDQSYSEVTLLDSEGQPIPLGAGGMIAKSVEKAKDLPDRDDHLGWLCYTLSPSNASPPITVRLRYTLGPWKKERQFLPDNNGIVALGNGSQSNAVGQDLEGKAFFAIAVDMRQDTARQFGVVALTKDGRELQSSRVDGGGGTGQAVRVERFQFAVPLADIAHFRLSTRPIRTVNFPKVCLRPRTDDSPTLAEQPPVVVETFPLSGARDVVPGTQDIRVRFSKPMEDGSWSWSTAWENSTPELIGQPHYEADGRTCVVKAKLEPGKTYAFWLNSDKFANFRDRSGRPAIPYLLIFQTKQK